MRDLELVAWASRSRVVKAERRSTDGVVVTEDTNEIGCLDYRGSGFRAFGPAILFIAGALRLKFASRTTLFYVLLCIGDNCMCFCWVGVNGK